jgi:hypothetical protein
LSRRRGLIITACVVAAIGLIITFAMQGPRGRFDGNDDHRARQECRELTRERRRAADSVIG